MDLNLKGKRALVVGASRGIGLEIWRQLVGEGASVVVAGHREETLKAAIAAESLPAEAIILVDTAEEASIDAALAKLDEEGLAIDILIISVARPGFDSVWDFGFSEWEANLRTKYVGSAHLARGVARRMIDRGQGGAIIMLSGIASTGVMGDTPATGGANAAIENFVKLLNSAAGPHGVRVLAVSPGTTVTPRFEQWADQETIETLSGLVPLGRMGRADELASAVVFLSSERAGYISGQTITVDGGLTTASRYRAKAPAPKA